MSKTNELLSKADEQEVIEAIKNAELNTSGEIRIHIEAKANKDAYERALDVFNELKMHQTEQRNGVLIYVAAEDKKFVICGDEGINNVVADDFWDCTRDTIAEHFKKGNFKVGIVAGILNAGIQLKQFFPWQTDDENELSNEISKG
ncbi:MAG: TPM domain-containing protein [Polaribacter sp.]|nr:TPM domain-containing protein [Polaribacter sp.]MDG1810572.1 TPM domain-containing protein [Polaribacter sp.]MDG1994113.1 TPM domain-containing protein [Polaribacter sp.]